METRFTPKEVLKAQLPPMSDEDRAEWESAIRELNNRYEYCNGGGQMIVILEHSYFPLEYGTIVISYQKKYALSCEDAIDKASQKILKSDTDGVSFEWLFNGMPYKIAEFCGYRMRDL